MSRAPNTACVSTTDIDQLVENVKPWDVRFTQLTPGKFDGRCEIVDLGALLIYRERWSQKVLATGVSPPGHFMMGYSVGADWCGRTVETGDIVCAAPGAEIDFITPVDCHNVVALLPVDRVEGLLAAEDDQARSGRLTPVGRVTRQRFVQLVRHAVAGPAALYDPYIARALEFSLMELFTGCFCSHRGYPIEMDRSRAWRTVLCSMECLDESDHALSMTELAQKVFVSQRTLEYAFRKTLGVTPLRFDHLRRMMGAHQELVRAEPDPTNTVAGIAARWGFNEPGRFAGYYRCLFMENPSETLRKPVAQPRAKLADIFRRDRLRSAVFTD